MTCKSCHGGEMLPTQLPRLLFGFGLIGYVVAFVAVLALGAGIGWLVALVRAGSLETSQAFLVLPLLLIAATPPLVFGAVRLFAEKKVWRCTACHAVLERA